ncbi:MAG: nicotinamide-nucleotide amidohydrolase family protein, partial [Bacteroidales bacterium]|nr:nicotinamide-nucleotide amidohydrolase family protein [Bacteroidales bacterium]
KLDSIISEYIYAHEESTLQEVTGRILKSNGWTVSCAESCTGGNIAAMLSSVPGASAYFMGSVTSYAVGVKENVLKVPAELIEKHGVVSEEVAIAMAEGVRVLTNSDFAVATTGVAGPGDSDGVPEGTVCIGFASAKESKAIVLRYRHDRNHNIQRFTASALNFLRSSILEYCK